MQRKIKMINFNFFSQAYFLFTQNPFLKFPPTQEGYHRRSVAKLRTKINDDYADWREDWNFFLREKVIFCFLLPKRVEKIDIWYTFIKYTQNELLFIHIISRTFF